MMRTWISMVAALGLASAASAATVRVDTDKKMYLAGETITVTATLTTSGGEPSAQEVALQLLWSDPQIAGTPGPALYPTALTTAVLGGFFTWTVGTGTCLATSCLVISQLAPVLPQGSVPDPAVIVSTLTMFADAIGPIDFSFGFVLAFGATPTFGPNASGAQVVSVLDLDMDGDGVHIQHCMAYCTWVWII